MLGKKSNKTLIGLLIALFCIALSDLGCKKHSGSPADYFTFQVGTKSYSIDSIRAIHFDSTTRGFAIFGDPNQADIATNKKIYCHFQMNNYSKTDTAVTGSYTCTTNAPNRSLCGSTLSILIPNDANVGHFFVGSDGLFTLTVTENNAEFVSGIFSGQLWGGALPVSNGRFKVHCKK